MYYSGGRQIAEVSLENFASLPNSFGSVSLGIATTALLGAAIAYNHYSARDVNSSGFNAALTSANPAIEAVMNSSQPESTHATHVAKQMRRRRYLAAIGLSCMAVATYQPQSEQTVPTDIPTVAVVDGSPSFLYTMDTSEGNRYDTAMQAVVSAFGSDKYPSEGNEFYRLDFANGVTISPKLTTKEEIIRALQANPVVDSNGGSLAEALQLTSELIGVADNKESASPRANVIVLTDGTVDSPKSTVRQLMNLEKNANLTIIRPGKDPAQYVFPPDGKSYDSSVSASFMDGLSEKSIKIASSDSQEIESQLNVVVEKNGYDTDKQPWLLPLYAGIGLLMTSALSAYKLAHRELRLSKNALKKGSK